jgi:hypothetical protein
LTFNLGSLVTDNRTNFNNLCQLTDEELDPGWSLPFLPWILLFGAILRLIFGLFMDHPGLNIYSSKQLPQPRELLAVVKTQISKDWSVVFPFQKRSGPGTHPVIGEAPSQVTSINWCIHSGTTTSTPQQSGRLSFLCVPALALVWQEGVSLQVLLQLASDPKI